MPIRPKVIRVVAKSCPVMVTMSYVSYIRRAFWSEYALVPVVFFRLVRHFTFDGGSPEKNFFDDGAQCANEEAVEHLRRWGDAYNFELTITESSPACARLCTLGKATIASTTIVHEVDLSALFPQYNTRVLLCRCLDSDSVHPQLHPLRLASDCVRPCLPPRAPAPWWLHHQAGSASGDRDTFCNVADCIQLPLVRGS